MKYYSLLLFFLTVSLSAQVVNMEKDTLQIEEVIIKSKKQKVKTYRMQAPCYHPENMKGVSEVITLFDKLPEGYIKSVSFYFNQQYTPGEEKQYADQQFELALYNVGEDNKVGERITHEPKMIYLSRMKSGRFTIDLSDLDIPNMSRLYAGIKRVGGVTSKSEFSVDCLCNGQDKYVTMARDEDGGWIRRWECAALKLDVSIVVVK